MSQDLRKKIISLHKKGEGYKKISKALLISQNTVVKVVQTFKKDGTATISQRRPGRPRKLTPRQEQAKPKGRSRALKMLLHTDQFTVQ